MSKLLPFLVIIIPAVVRVLLELLCYCCSSVTSSSVGIGLCCYVGVAAVAFVVVVFIREENGR